MTEVSTPIKIGAYTLKNRLTFAPTVKFDYTDDSGLVTEKHITHYAERAQGGCGLICVEATAVLPGGRFGKNHLGLWNDEQIDGHKAITEACHKEGAVVIIQLNHTGYTANPECGPAIGPSEIKMQGFRGEYMTTALDKAGIKEVQEAYVAAAVRAKKAGYDGIQFHGCHGYLINQFLSPAHNLRTDEYGGSPENRARFCSEMMAKVRELCGPEFMISVRTSGCEDTVEDALQICEQYVAAGCDYLQVSFGMSSLDDITPFPNEKVTGLHSVGARFHEHFKGRVPVSVVWNLLTPEPIKYLIENDIVDTVDLARAVLADPNFANAVVNGTEFTKCFECQRCQYGPFTAHTCPAELVRNKK